MRTGPTKSLCDDVQDPLSVGARHLPEENLFRGGNSMMPSRRDLESVIIDGNEWVNPTSSRGFPQGISVNVDPKNNWIQVHGGAHKIDLPGLPDGLAIVQQGKDPGHFVIAPEKPMLKAEYIKLLQMIRLDNFNSVPLR